MSILPSPPIRVSPSFTVGEIFQFLSTCIIIHLGFLAHHGVDRSWFLLIFHFIAFVEEFLKEKVLAEFSEGSLSSWVWNFSLFCRFYYSSKTLSSQVLEDLVSFFFYFILFLYFLSFQSVSFKNWSTNYWLVCPFWIM